MSRGSASRSKFAVPALVAYFIALATFVAVSGVPADTSQVMLWVIIGLCVVSAFSRRRRVIRVFLDWLPFAMVLFAWDWSRGIAVRVGLPVHVQLPVDIDGFCFAGTVPTVWLQDHLAISKGQTHAWEIFPTLVYVTHFLATPIVAAVLWIKNRARWLAYLKRFLSLMVVGLVMYILLPWSPPWLASIQGHLPPLHRATPDGWQYLHLSEAGTLLSVGQAGANENAAMPSLHAAFAMLISLFLWSRAGRRGRVALAGYPVARGFSLVLTSEH
jgi:hypothetical protein